jgi:hypothetical protein
MPNAELDGLRAELAEMEDADVRSPNMPPAMFIQETYDLLAFVEGSNAKDKLINVGVDAARLDAIRVGIAAMRQAQSVWTVSRDRSKSEDQKEREAAGFNLRQSMTLACRWNLRAINTAQAALDEIAAGDGIEDLIQDLHDLAALVRGHGVAFAADKTFDATAKADAAEAIGAAISAGLSSTRLDTAQREAKNLRDRAYTHVLGQVLDLRRAGRYTFAGEPSALLKFGSAYQRRVQRRRRGSDEVEAPTE